MFKRNPYRFQAYISTDQFHYTAFTPRISQQRISHLKPKLSSTSCLRSAHPTWQLSLHPTTLKLKTFDTVTTGCYIKEHFPPEIRTWNGTNKVCVCLCICWLRPVLTVHACLSGEESSSTFSSSSMSVWLQLTGLVTSGGCFSQGFFCKDTERKINSFSWSYQYVVVI